MNCWAGAGCLVMPVFDKHVGYSYREDTLKTPAIYSASLQEMSYFERKYPMPTNGAQQGVCCWFRKRAGKVKMPLKRDSRALLKIT